MPWEELAESSAVWIRRQVLLAEAFRPLRRAAFDQEVEAVRSRLRVVLNDLRQRGRIARIAPPRTATPGAPVAKPTTGLAAELEALAPARFPERIDALRMPHLPRCLRALAIRAERAALNPAKDAERARSVNPYTGAAARLSATPPSTPEGRALAAVKTAG